MTITHILKANGDTYCKGYCKGGLNAYKKPYPDGYWLDAIIRNYGKGHINKIIDKGFINCKKCIKEVKL